MADQPRLLHTPARIGAEAHDANAPFLAWPNQTDSRNCRHWSDSDHHRRRVSHHGHGLERIPREHPSRRACAALGIRQSRAAGEGDAARWREAGIRGDNDHIAAQCHAVRRPAMPRGGADQSPRARIHRAGFAGGPEPQCGQRPAHRHGRRAGYLLHDHHRARHQPQQPHHSAAARCPGRRRHRAG